MVKNLSNNNTGKCILNIVVCRLHIDDKRKEVMFKICQASVAFIIFNLFQQWHELFSIIIKFRTKDMTVPVVLPCLITLLIFHCPACRTSLIATRFWVVVICPIIKCLTVLEFYFILIDLCLFITIFNFILNYVPIVTFWIFTYHKILILLIIFCFIWSYWIVYFLTCLEVFWSVVSLLWPWLIKWK